MEFYSRLRRETRDQRTSEPLAQFFKARLQGVKLLFESSRFLRIQTGIGEKVKRGVVRFARIHPVPFDLGTAFGPQRYAREGHPCVQFGIHEREPALMVIMLALGEISHRFEDNTRSGSYIRDSQSQARV